MTSFNRLWAAIAAVSLTALPACSGSPNSTESVAPAASPTATSHAMTSHSGAAININTAILSELDKLEAALAVPGLSNQIQASRPYGSVEDLVAKQVLTQEQFDQVKDMVTVEDITLTGEAKDVDYLLKLSLMQGHLLVAQELLNQNLPDQAEPHIGHPVEEIYLDLEEQLQERSVPEFKSTLIGLQDLVKSNPQAAELKTQFDASVQAIDAAIDVLPAEQRQSPAFILQVVQGLLSAAGAEYTAAIADGKISEIIEYQDSRGFVIYADRLIESIDAQLTAADPEAQQALKAAMTDLLTAWPTATAPDAPVKTPEQVTQLITTIDQQAQLLSQ
jgi:DNA uptake protein ComE-like DNA-binding protein